MKRSSFILILALSLVLSAFVPASAAAFFYGDTPLSYRMDGLEEFILEIQENYKDEVGLDTLFNGIYKGLLESLDDPWSCYFSYDDGREYYTEVSEQYAGIGVSCRAFDDGQLLILALVEDGPADRAGLHSGDIITKIGSTPTSGTDPQESVKLLRGEAGTTVALTVERGEETLLISVIRQDIVNKACIESRMLDGDIACIRIGAFDPGCAAAFGEALRRKRDEGARALILDLRNCPGGYLEEAVAVADCLIPIGGRTICSYQKKGRTIETKLSTYSVSYHLPTVCLINRETASAAEMLAAALQENDAARLVGETSYGKGVGQDVIETVQNHGYRLSVCYFLTPTGRTIDGVGVAPDFAVKNDAGLSEAERAAINEVLAPMTETKKYRAGESGLNVYAAQQRLRALGFELPLSAIMDAPTVAAVESLQREIGGYPYPCLDYGTMEGLERLFNEYINGSGEDRQLQCAMEILQKDK